MEYIRNPTPQTWYAAHNASIIEGYRTNEDLAYQESYAERVLISSVLTRVVLAEAMVNSELGFIADLADPSGMSMGELGTFHAVDTITDLNIYPKNYPLNEFDKEVVIDTYTEEHIANLIGVLPITRYTYEINPETYAGVDPSNITKQAMKNWAIHNILPPIDILDIFNLGF